MAQWLGQFTGHTHQTRLADVEETLRGAISAFRTASIDERSKKAKAIGNLVKRLISVRARYAKAKLVVASQVGTSEAMEHRAAEVATLNRKLELLKSIHPTVVLKEFGAEDLTDSLGYESQLTDQ